MKWFIVVVVFDGVADSAEIRPTREKARQLFKKRTGFTWEEVDEAEPDSEAGHFQGSEIFHAEVKAPPIPSRKVSYQIVVPTEEGEDLHSEDDNLDAHIRVESYAVGRLREDVETKIFVDLFKAGIGSPNEAYITTQAFPDTKEGAMEATDFLLENNFKVHVSLK